MKNKNILMINIFTIFSYLLLFLSIVLFIVFSFVSFKPIEIFSQSFDIFSKNIFNFRELDDFDDHGTYAMFAKEINKCKNWDELYNKINDFYSFYESKYVGLLNIDSTKRYFHKKKNIDNYIVKKISNDTCIIKIQELWNEKTIDKIYTDINKYENIVFDLRNSGHGTFLSWLKFSKLILGNDIVWDRYCPSAFNKRETFIFKELKSYALKGKNISIVINKDSFGMPVNIINEIITSENDNYKIYSDNIKFQNALFQSYYILKNKMILYLPIYELRTSNSEISDNIHYTNYINYFSIDQFDYKDSL